MSSRHRNRELLGQIHQLRDLVARIEVSRTDWDLIAAYHYGVLDDAEKALDHARGAIGPVIRRSVRVFIRKAAQRLQQEQGMIPA